MTYWKDIPKTALVKRTGAAYIVIIDGKADGVYWMGQEAKLATDRLDLLAGQGNPGLLSGLVDHYRDEFWARLADVAFDYMYTAARKWIEKYPTRSIRFIDAMGVYGFDIADNRGNKWTNFEIEALYDMVPRYTKEDPWGNTKHIRGDAKLRAIFQELHDARDWYVDIEEVSIEWFTIHGAKYVEKEEDSKCQAK